jgi:prevent-host-death family protein
MASVSVTDLKAHLSRYLRMVRRGSEVQILERGVPVARLIRLERGVEGPDKKRVAYLAEQGVLRRGIGNLKWLLEEGPLQSDNLALGTALDEDREDRV